MKKLLALIIALAASVGISASSFGGSMMLMGVGGPGAAVSATYNAGNCANNFNNFSTAAQTFTSVQGGAYTSNGLAVIGFVQSEPLTPPPSTGPITITVGGRTAIYISGSDDGSIRSSIWYASITAGDTDTVVLTEIGAGEQSKYTAMCAAFITGMTGAPTASSKLAYGGFNGGVTVTAPFNVPNGGFGVVLYGSSNPVATGTGEVITFVNTSAARDQNTLNAANIQATMAHVVGPQTTWSPTATGSPNSVNFAYSLSAAAWGP